MVREGQPVNPLNEAEATACLEKLQALRQPMQDLMDFLEPRLPHVRRSDWQEARDRLKRLKDPFRAEYRRLDTKKGKASLTETERNYYYWAVVKAWPVLSGLSPTSTPDGKWHRDLYEARMDIDDLLDSLKGELDDQARAT